MYMEKLFDDLDLKYLEYITEEGCVSDEEITLEGDLYWAKISVSVYFDSVYNYDYNYITYSDIEVMVDLIDYGMYDLDDDIELTSKECEKLTKKLENYIYAYNFH